MDKEQVRGMLPTIPPKGLLEWTLQHCSSELGRGMMIFKGVRVEESPMLEEIMERQSFRGKKIWAAECTCSECGEIFLTAGGGKSLWLASGEDGCMYTVDPWDGIEDADCFCDKIQLAENDRTACPYCDNNVNIIHASKLRGGRTNRIMVVSVERIGEYMALLCWIVAKQFTDYGVTDTWAEPRDAYVLDEKGRFVHFTHTKKPGAYSCEVKLDSWRLTKSTANSLDCCYNSWDGFFNRKKGGYLYPVVPSLVGTTGEKTGLREYAQQTESPYLLEYIKLWKKCRAIENLANSGFGKLIYAALQKSSYDSFNELQKMVDTTKAKPHEMLGMSKAEFRALASAGAKWGRETQIDWKKYKECGGTLHPDGFLKEKDYFGHGYTIAITLMKNYGDSLEKLHRYLDKQNLTGNQISYLSDTRSNAELIYGRKLTGEELWPRNLREAHDRLARQVAEVKDAKKAALTQVGFAEAFRKYGCLEWTDGELCIRMPRSSLELRMEGDILRHCVGGYSNKHIAEKDTIFFVRHYRRPERSYYTLDINMTAEEPEEVQLHGYGNECHGEHKQYRHSIPKKVRAFVDRWKREVLLPWAMAQKKGKKERKSA